MKEILILALFMFASVPVAHAFSKLDGGISADAIRNQDGRLLIPCSFNEHATTCVLDTGAVKTIPPNGSWFDDLPSLKSEIGKSAQGQVRCDLVAVDVLLKKKFHLANQVVRRCEKLYGDFAKGTVGIDLVGQFAMKFDFGNDKFELLSDPGIADAHEPLDRAPNGWLLVPSLFAGEAIEVFWDTGISSDGWVDTEFVQSHPNLFHLEGHEEIHDIAGGAIQAANYETSALQVGGRSFSLILKAVDISRFPLDRKKVPIFLGFEAIKKANWFMDTVHGKWSFF